MSKKKGKDFKNKTKFIKGKLDITRSGIGYVIVEGVEKDIFIRPHDFGKALHGDTVRISIKEHNGKRPEGRVEEVLERKQTDFIGNIEVSESFAFFNADTQKPMPDFYVSLKKLNGAKDKDRVVVRLINWADGDKKPEGEVVSVVQAKDVNDMAMKEILIESGFPLEFTKEVLEETSQLNENKDAEEILKRKDCRDILTFTIDPVDAKDFDDAISIRKLKNDNYEIGVHIADVSHFVTPGTALDESAYERATSVYLPDRVNPMLPEKISNELCSLRPNEDKFTFSAIFQINDKAQVKNFWLGKTIIHSDRRFTYEEVQEIIVQSTPDGEKKEGDHKDEILLLNDLAQQFRKQRFKNGAINFSSTEVRFTLDEHGKPTGIVVKESKEAHQLIEEFMLLANRTVAQYVSKLKVNKKPIPFPYRIHDKPDDEKLKPFVAFARKFGYKFDLNDEAVVAASFNQMLKDVQGRPEQHVLEQLGIRTMAKAIYTSENIGHYGLGFEHYCHFTSPIRRYPDILVHRVLEEILEKNIRPDKKMEEKCKHSSAKERSAMEAERNANKYKQVEYMQDFIGEEFEGVINGVSSFGFWVETVAHKCEGLVSVRDLSEYDDFRLNETDYALVGLRSGRKFRMGDIVTIKVISANLGKRQLDYEWVVKPESQTHTPKPKKIKIRNKK
ncbi:MAG: ribonuclease R [Chitinophagaceae bacterium]|nr:ribonuclease R [Chitinophagaceae bacterium]